MFKLRGYAKYPISSCNKPEKTTGEESRPTPVDSSQSPQVPSPPRSSPRAIEFQAQEIPQLRRNIWLLSSLFPLLSPPTGSSLHPGPETRAQATREGHGPPARVLFAPFALPALQRTINPHMFPSYGFSNFFSHRLPSTPFDYHRLYIPKLGKFLFVSVFVSPVHPTPQNTSPGPPKRLGCALWVSVLQGGRLSTPNINWVFVYPKTPTTYIL
jgi:hypothetical protein